MYPTADSSNHPMDIPTDNRGWIANSGCALLRNDDTIVLRSMIRRTRDVRLVSDGTLYERIDGALEEAIEKVRNKRRSALSVVTTSHSWTFIKLRSKNIDFLLVTSGTTFHYRSQHTELPP